MRCPFAGRPLPTRVRLFKRGRPGLPIPLPWNYRDPLRILDTYFHGTEDHTRYFHEPGLPLGLVTRDPAVIRQVLLATGDKPGQFDRDTAPSRGIARATGEDSLLYANGAAWRRQKRLAAPPFSRSTLFRPEKFHEFEATFRRTVAKRLDVLRQAGIDRVALEKEINVVMLEMLVNNFFGADVPYEELRGRYVPAINGLIAHMVRDTVGHQVLRPVRRLVDRRVRAWERDFEALTDIVLDGRPHGRGAWAQFPSDVPDERLRSNIRVFLAGALEATSSLACWALTHLAHRPDVQDQIHKEIKDLDAYDPENLAQAVTLNRVLDETLRLTPSLYFLPRRATADVWVDVDKKRRLFIPNGTHVVLDIWHANRCEAFWGKEATGHPADVFEPGRWASLTDRPARDVLHFGFGHGPRVCPGRFLGLLEAGLVVGGFVKVFRFSAVNEATPRAAVSTKPADGTVLRLERR